MKRLKLLIEFIKLKHKGYNKDARYFKYAVNGLIKFEEYEKYIDKEILRTDKKNGGKKYEFKRI